MKLMKIVENMKFENLTTKGLITICVSGLAIAQLSTLLIKGLIDVIFNLFM